MQGWADYLDRLKLRRSGNSDADRPGVSQTTAGWSRNARLRGSGLASSFNEVLAEPARPARVPHSGDCFPTSSVGMLHTMLAPTIPNSTTTNSRLIYAMRPGDSDAVAHSRALALYMSLTRTEPVQYQVQEGRPAISHF
jgi:hypothetical protein